MKKMIFLGLVVFLFAAIWQLPLALVTPYIEKSQQGIQLDDVSGTIWQGKANHLTIKNTYLGQVTWKVRPLESLTALALTAAFTIKGEQLNATGIASITPKKKLLLNNTQFDMSANTFNKFQRMAKVSGDIKGHINKAIISQKPDLPIIYANIDWKDASLKSPITLTQGDYHAIIRPKSDNMNIQLSATDAPIELNGVIEINKSWRYDTNITLKPKAPELEKIFSFLGKRQTDGRIQIQQKGDLKPFIFK